MDKKGDKGTEKKGLALAKYSAVAVQMLATIGACVFIGYKIDQNRQSDIPLFTALLGLFGVIISLYQVIKSVRSK